MRPELVPLNIPKDWTIVWNNFTQSNPEDFIDRDYIHVWEFQEKIFFILGMKKKKDY